MAGRPTAPRPLSPHLSIWKWKVHMLVSILHRATGQAMALGGVVLFLWWLIAAATGPEAYAFFMIVATSWLGLLVGIGLTWVFFQHMMTGIRHLVMDTGQAFDIETSRTFALMTMVASVLLTATVWAYILLGKGY
ncbi:MAG: succinate dehydrogenase, cytochrome b556 subunit [Polymorphobacter sp.]|uniref:succinate dehydrogenase, cytochrome b556 subunit n=1 Tax=Polymorphobacter sp. TaxID=1909290 RepID=UPI003A837785